MGRKVEDLAARFERLVDRTGEHHLWLGSLNRDRETGRIKVGNTVATAHRVAWELGHGPLLPKQRVVTCPSYPACVRLEHLTLDGASAHSPESPARSRKGAGSMRMVRTGTWELRVTVGRWDNGRPRSLTRTVSAKSESAAAALLAEFVDEMTDSQLPESRDLRDLTVDEAV